MPDFVMNRDLTLNSIHGHSIAFKKGVTTHVPKALIPEVVAAGGLPPDGEQVVLEDPVDKDKGPEDAGERQIMMIAAFEEIIARNNRDDFTAGNTPHAKALSKVLGWTVSAAERDAAWAEFQKAE